MENKEFKKEFLVEIALMALTYRVSYKNLAKLLKISEEEISSSLESLSEFSLPLYQLKKETINEDKINERVAYINARNYLLERNKLIMELREAKRTKTPDEVKKCQENIKKHFAKVDDTIVASTIGKRTQELTEKELESITRYRLKYGLSKKACSSIIRRGTKTIKALEERLAEKNPIFKEKIEDLDQYWKEINLDCATDRMKLR